MTTLLAVTVSIAAVPCVQKAGGQAAARQWLHVNLENGDGSIEFRNAVRAGAAAFPVYDEAVINPIHVNTSNIERSFLVLEKLTLDCSKYVSSARKYSTSKLHELRASSIGFLSKHGDHTDIKMALTFFCSSNPAVVMSCADLLVSFGDAEELRLFRAVMDSVDTSWEPETREYVRAASIKLEQKIASKVRKNR